MKIEEVNKLVADGARVVIGEFKGPYEVKEFAHKTKVGKFNVREKFRVLFKDDFGEVGGFLNVERATAAAPCPYKAGDKVVVVDFTWVPGKYGIEVAGKHYPLTK